ncbi:protein MKS1-like [Phoenix dactylifera]|uniref:Protein MKS1-like n=1 Tax=Phoenix dactylifera TaxID=42345 RepID=A0A8B7BKJ5_PHODC|nr:protein MKS1-like [Phoenix dactylifera]
MDPSDVPRPSPRRELQGPRPTPLKVRKDSYKIKKPPPASSQPGAAAPPPPQPPPPHNRPPVIIYTVSPKIIHTKPSDFMTLVQRLTGPDSSAGPSTDASLPSPSSYGGGALSPAARLAAFEKSAPSSDGDRARSSGLDVEEPFGMDGGGPVVDRAGSFPGILSPMPASLPPISPNFFSPITSFDTTSLSFLQELSPVFAGNKSFMDAGASTILPSPNYFLSTPTVPSPGSCWDLLSQLPDF